MAQHQNNSPQPQPARGWSALLDELSPLEEATLARAFGAACALIAHADGWPTAQERAGMLRLIRETPEGARLGADAVMKAFEEASDGFAEDPEAAERRAIAALTEVGVDAEAAWWLASASCAIAEADGGYDAEERTAALRICQALGVDPAALGLQEAR